MTQTYRDDDRDESNSNSSTLNPTTQERLPYPEHGDSLDDHVAFRDGHVAEQVWWHKARDVSAENGTVDHEYHHSESRVRIQSTSNPNEVIYSNWVVNLERMR